MSDKIVFTSRGINLNIVKHKGATIVTATPGGTKSEQTPTSWIKFRDYKCITGDEEEIQIIRQHMKDYPNDGIKEVIPRTHKDILEEEQAKLTEQMKKVEVAKGLVGEEDKKEEEPEEEFNVGKDERDVTENKTPEGKYKCWLGKCTFSCDSIRGLRLHLKASHNRNIKQETLKRKLAEKRNESNVQL